MNSRENFFNKLRWPLLLLVPLLVFMAGSAWAQEADEDADEDAAELDTGCTDVRARRLAGRGLHLCDRDAVGFHQRQCKRTGTIGKDLLENRVEAHATPRPRL